jgi:hypothetical protein
MLRYAETAERIVKRAHSASARTALSYLNRFRKAELNALGLVADGLNVALPNELSAGEVERLVNRYGQGFMARLINGGASAEEAKRLALARQLGDVVGSVLSGGRKVVDDGISNDRRCIGWRRVASPSCCSFCAMLASRGAVYKDQKSALGSRKGGGRGGRGAGVHRACQCHMEPVYSRKSKPAPNEARYERLWREANGDPLQFRRLIEGRA